MRLPFMNESEVRDIVARVYKSKVTKVDNKML